MRPLFAIRQFIDRQLSKPTAAGPLCISNRTKKQQLLQNLAVALPFVAVFAGVFFLPQLKPSTQAPRTLSQAELAEKILPDMSAVPVTTNQELKVRDFQIIRSGSSVVLQGSATNVTPHSINAARISFALANQDGSLVGSANTELQDLEPGQSSNFRIPLEATDSFAALVRDIQTE
jgi:hypothetical protein